MRNIMFPVVLFACLWVIACNNSGPGKGSQKQQADSLEKEVLKEHDIAMPKSMRIPKLKKEIQRQIDSISTLPAKAQEAAAAFKTKLETLIRDLDYADFAMDKWMGEFSFDSARNNLEQRIKYLTEEKMKVSKVKEAVLNGLARADSLLKANF